MRIADRELSRATGLARLRRYAKKYPDTIRFYDLAGDPDASPGPGGAAEPVNEVTLADMGRLVVINAELRADDVGKLMDVRPAQAFEAVAPTAQLEECSHGSELYAAATVLYEKYRFKHGSNIGRAKRSKLLHIKRPWLVPILDEQVWHMYRSRAQHYAKIRDQYDGSWEVVREDLCDGTDDLAWLAAQLSADDDPQVRRLGRLTKLRLLDILAWIAASM
jgi:Family of unknown function (DUF6308)